MSSSERATSDAAGPAGGGGGLDNITGLQTARILAARSVPVYGVVADRRHWGARTNACVEVVESPLSGPGLVAALALLGRRLDRPAVLLPCSDAAVDTVSRHRGQLAEHGYLLALSEHPVVELLMDKVRFAQYAEEHDLPVPRTEVLSDRSRRWGRGRLDRLPVRAQAAVQDARVAGAHERQGVHRARTRRAFLEVYDRVEHWVPFLLAQEWIPGDEDELYSCNAVFGAGGRPLATFVARKVRQWPPDIGTSASGEECRNEEVLDTTIRLFGGLGYRGLAYLEMKRDARTGRLWIVEPNVGRPPAARRSPRPAASSWCTPPTATPPDCRSRPRGSSGTARRGGWTCAGTCRRPSSPGAAGPSRCGRGCGRCVGPRRTPSGRAATRAVRRGPRRRCPHRPAPARRLAGTARHRLPVPHDDRGRGLGMNQGADVTGVLGWGSAQVRLADRPVRDRSRGRGPRCDPAARRAVPGDRPGGPRPRAAHPQHRRAAEDGHRRVRQRPEGPRGQEGGGHRRLRDAGSGAARAGRRPGQHHLHGRRPQHRPQRRPEHRQCRGVGVRGGAQRVQPGRGLLLGHASWRPAPRSRYPEPGRPRGVGPRPHLRPARGVRRRRAGAAGATTRHRRGHGRAGVGRDGPRPDHPRPRGHRGIGDDPALPPASCPSRPAWC